jgi:predicted aldo/keto reductase-like oxidoreductase
VNEHYFERVRATTGGRFWVNNPTIEEMDLALEHGAMGCTTNPSYGGNLVKRAPQEVLPIVQECLPASACYQVVREREYPVTLLYGGARIELDFSGLVGGGTVGRGRLGP